MAVSAAPHSASSSSSSSAGAAAAAAAAAAAEAKFLVQREVVLPQVRDLARQLLQQRLAQRELALLGAGVPPEPVALALHRLEDALLGAEADHHGGGGTFRARFDVTATAAAAAALTTTTTTTTTTAALIRLGG